MNMAKSFLEELKTLVESRNMLTECRIEKLEEKFNQSSYSIVQTYQLLLEHFHILPFVDDIELFVYDYVINQECKNGKTHYGAVMAAAEFFQMPQTYINYKINQYKQIYLQKTA